MYKLSQVHIVTLRLYCVHTATNMLLSWKHLYHVLIHLFNFIVGQAQYDVLT